MVNKQEVRKDEHEMMRNSERTVMFISKIRNYCNPTMEQTRAFFDYTFANLKQQMELYPFATQERKKSVILNKEYPMLETK